MAILGKQTKSTPVRILLFYPGGGTFLLMISEYIFRSNLRNHKVQHQ